MPRLLHLLSYDLGDLLHGLVDLPIIVHDDVVVFGRGRHLDLRVAHPKLALVAALGAPLVVPLAKPRRPLPLDERGPTLPQHRLDPAHSLALRLDVPAP